MNKKDGTILFCLFLILVTVKLPSFDLRLDPDNSGANAFFARQMLRCETLYEKYHPAHHLPGIYYTFELAFRLFGDNPNAPKLLLLPWVLVSAWLLFMLGRSLFDSKTGLLSAIFFILVSSQDWVTGLTVEMEHFANLPLIAGMFISVALLRKQAPAWNFFWVGLLGAIAILYKVIFVAPLISTGVTILVAAWVSRHEPGSWKTLLLRAIWLGIGLVTPLAMVFGYFASLGLWDRFMLIFQFGPTFFNDSNVMFFSSLPRPFGYPFFWMSLNNFPLLVLGLFTAYRLLHRSIPIKSGDHLADFSLAMWLIVSAALAGLRGGGFPHYVLPLIPPLALAGAVEIVTSYQRWKKRSSPIIARAGAGVMVGLIVISFLWANHTIYGHYLSYKLGGSREAFLRGIEEYPNHTLTEYVKAHTTSDDLIYFWSIYMDVYYYTDRLPPLDIFWPSYVGATGSPNRIFAPRTKYIILDKPEIIVRPQWLLDGLKDNYELETVLDEREIYRRKSP